MGRNPAGVTDGDWLSPWLPGTQPLSPRRPQTRRALLPQPLRHSRSLPGALPAAAVARGQVCSADEMHLIIPH